MNDKGKRDRDRDIRMKGNTTLKMGREIGSPMRFAVAQRSNIMKVVVDESQ